MSVCLPVCQSSLSQSFSFSLPANVAFCFACSCKAQYKPVQPLIGGHDQIHNDATGTWTVLQLISWWLGVHFCGYHGDVKLWPAEDFFLLYFGWTSSVAFYTHTHTHTARIIVYNEIMCFSSLCLELVSETWCCVCNWVKIVVSHCLILRQGLQVLQN